jgi:crotonobetainyl-CoA:carnitine CoA-transferase CaiB-like acyl-CoA transferase
MSSSVQALPLQGMRVLEIGGGVPAAFATRWMMGYGADVVRSEGPEDSLTSDEQAFLLPGKRRISSDTARLRELALAADLVVEDGAPGALASRGLDPCELRRQKPALVITSLTPFGQDGPHAGWASSNLIAHAAGGILSLTGVTTRAPLQNGGNQAWLLLGLNGFSASLAAWFGALVHGEGDWLDISAQECAAGMLEYAGPRAAFDGTPALRLGNRVNAIWGIYACADGFAGVCALQRQAAAFLQLIGDPELLQPRFLDPAQRVSNDVELGQRVERWFADKTKAELLELGEKHKVPIGAVLTPLELLDNASLGERGFFDNVETPAGRARIPGRPFLGLDWRAGELHAAAADTDSVQRDWLRDTR